MHFDYDINKSKLNKEKHGIDFTEAIELWNTDYILAKGYFKDEIRYLLIGKRIGKMYTCVFTERFNKIRIISCRRSRKSEEVLYYEKIN